MIMKGFFEIACATGCARIFREKVSGAQTDRAELKKLLRALRNGDLILVTRLDRPAGSTRDLLDILDTAKGKGAESWAGTTTAHGRLLDVPGGYG
jgi:DNA invertase Pin-like site-specific DNA recombinase